MPSDIPPQLPIDQPPKQVATFGSVPAAAVIAECLRVQRGGRRVPLSPASSAAHPCPRILDRGTWVQPRGELDVARRLEVLGPDWTVLHAVPIGTRGSDVDHVAVGPAGVFTINTKFHEDAKVWVGSRASGERAAQGPSSKRRYEAERVGKLLAATTGGDVTVTGIVAIVGAKEITVREQPADVRVLRATELVRWLRRQKPQLQPERVEKLAMTMSRRDTWTAMAAVPDDRTEFTALQREVGAAKRTRMLWAAGSLLAVVGIAAPLAFDSYARVLAVDTAQTSFRRPTSSCSALEGRRSTLSRRRRGRLPAPGQRVWRSPSYASRSPVVAFASAGRRCRGSPIRPPPKLR